MDTDTYAKDLRNVINDRWYTTKATKFGEELNERSELPEKGQNIEKTVERASNFRLKVVDQIGYDFIDEKLGYKVELKFASYSMITERGMPRDHITIRIKNNRGSNKGVIIEHPADYYIICQENAMAIISGKDIQNYLVAKSDGIDARIPYSKMSFIFKYSEPFNVPMESYKALKEKFRNDYHDEFDQKILEIINAAQ